MPGGTRTAPGKNVVQDCVALAEIELCGDLMIAASDAEAAGEERLSVARIDEVLGAAGVRLEKSAPPARRT